MFTSPPSSPKFDYVLFFVTHIYLFFYLMAPATTLIKTQFNDVICVRLKLNVLIRLRNGIIRGCVEMFTDIIDTHMSTVNAYSN